MTKPVKQTIGHKLKLRIKSIKIDKRLICPRVIDESVMTRADIKNAKAYNWVFWGLFAVMAIWVLYGTYPHVGRMFSALFIVLLFFIGFCSLSNSIRMKKSPAGPKEKKKLFSFADCFVKEEDYQRFHKYISETFTKDFPMQGGHAIAIIDVMKEDKLTNEGEAPIATMILKDYRPLGIVTFKDARAATGAKHDSAKKAAVRSAIGAVSGSLPMSSK